MCEDVTNVVGLGILSNAHTTLTKKNNNNNGPEAPRDRRSLKKDFSHPTVRWCFQKINEIEEEGREERKKKCFRGYQPLLFSLKLPRSCSCSAGFVPDFQTSSVQFIFFSVERTSTAKSPGRHLIDNYQL